MKKSFKALLGAGILLPVFAFTLKEAQASKGNAEGDKDYLLILGYKLHADEAQPMLKMRCAKAAEYLTKHENTVAIACGGITDKNQTKSEAQVIKELLVANGIDEKRIILENKSTTTAENFYNAKKIINNPNAQLALLSSDFHLLRASMLAKKCGLNNIQTVSAATPHEMRTLCFIREFFAFSLTFINLKEAEKNG